MSEQYKIIVDKVGYYNFTMPDGFEDNVEVHLFGAGGGVGASTAGGAGGGYVKSNVTISSGDQIGVVVGGGGRNSSGATGGAYGSGCNLGFAGGRGGNGTDPEDNDAGGGGGGGGATAVITLSSTSTANVLSFADVSSFTLGTNTLINNYSIFVDDVANAGGPDNVPLAVPPHGGNVLVFGWTAPTSPETRVCTTTNKIDLSSYSKINYSVLVGSRDGWGDVPESGEPLKLQYSSDGTTWRDLDSISPTAITANVWVTRNVAVGSEAREQDVYLRFWQYRTGATGAGQKRDNWAVDLALGKTPGYTALAVAAGGAGGGGYGDDGASGATAGTPGGVATIIHTSTNGQNGKNGSGGGGAGYPTGGATGIGYGDDGPGSHGGYGGQNYGDVTIAGSAKISGGIGTEYYPGASTGNAGYDGYAVLVFTKKAQMQIKDSGNWKNITEAWVKTNDIDRTLISPPETRTFTSSGLWTVPAGVTSFSVTVNGAGGGGGGYHSGCSGTTTHPGGNGGGGYTNSGTFATIAGRVLNFTIGSAGVGGTASNDGTDGGATTLSGAAVLSVAGGKGGIQGTSSGPGANGIGGGLSNGGLGGKNRDSDPDGKNGGNGSVSITYTVVTKTSAWKKILNAWVKADGKWKRLTSSNTISVIKITETIDTSHDDDHDD